MIKLLERTEISPIVLLPGDSLEITYTPPGLFRRTRVLLTETVDATYRVTEVGVFSFEDEFGVKRGIGGYFGEGEEK